MRQLPKRPDLPKPLAKRLARETRAITSAVDPKAEATRRYANARATKWFRPVLHTLRTLAGTGGRCMFCSGSESSNIDHYRPQAVFPELAMLWENYLWVCGICNGSKLSRFPLAVDELLINPLEENVWEYFFLDDQGRLTARWSLSHNALHPRALSTMKLISLDRDDLQNSRWLRLIALRREANDSITLCKNNHLTKTALRKRVADWRAEPFQSDVADYFLNGPGREEEPFAELFELLE